ncbi:transposase, partial [Shigella flexneri]
STLKSPSYTKSVSWQHYQANYINKHNHAVVFALRLAPLVFFLS